MVTREYRLAEFSNSPPTEGLPVELLCEDHAGTYLLPFPCRWTDGAWHNGVSGALIDARVVGWRVR
jgi:hypothetical protein